MSYILEALKMSEQSRRQRVDGLQYSLMPALEESVEPRRLPRHLWVASALLINAAVAVLWWPTAPPSAPAPVQTPKTMPEAAQPVSPLPAVVVAKEAAPLSAMLPVPLPVAPPAITLKTASPRAPAIAPPAPETSRHAEAKPPAPAKPPVAAINADSPEGMTANLMKQLPPINIAGYIRDAEGNRLVMVNDKLLRENEELAPGLKLENILDEGLVFNFKGHRFKR